MSGLTQLHKSCRKNIQARLVGYWKGAFFGLDTEQVRVRLRWTDSQEGRVVKLSIWWLWQLSATWLAFKFQIWTNIGGIRNICDSLLILCSFRRAQSIVWTFFYIRSFPTISPLCRSDWELFCVSSDVFAVALPVVTKLNANFFFVAAWIPDRADF